jgi:hypothetical protein
MRRIRSISVLLLVLNSLLAFSQEKDSSNIKLSHYSLAIGTGWTHYFNNLEYGDKNITSDFGGISFRFFWEPEYRLSLGLESGYYRLFKVKGQLTPDITGEAVRSVIPMLLLARMRIVDNFYLGTGFGLAIIKNKTTGGSQQVNTSTLSLSNYEATASYIYPINTRFHIGGEMKLNNYGSLNDWMYSLQVFGAIRF